MKLNDWKDGVYHLTVRVIRGRKYPLLLKDWAWKLAAFAVTCGESNPISFAVRPLLMHSRWRLTVGVYLGFTAITASIIGPQNLSARQSEQSDDILMLPEPQINISTVERVAFPIPIKEVSQGFWLLHKGVDFRIPEGTSLNPVMAGIVVEAEYNKSGYGNNIVVDHQNGYKSLYAHLSTIDVQVGHMVTTDTVIGKTGNTGRSTGPHLHLELWENGMPINPEKLLGK